MNNKLYKQNTRNNLVQTPFINEITFVGHSKGGAEAAGNAIKNNKNAMIFNPATVSLGPNKLTLTGYTGTITSYIVTGDALHLILGYNKESHGTAIYLPNQHKTTNKSTPIDIFKNALKNHSMDSVISALKEVGY